VSRIAPQAQGDEAAAGYQQMMGMFEKMNKTLRLTNDEFEWVD